MGGGMRNEEGFSGIEDVKKYEELRENRDNYWEVGDWEEG